MSWTKDLPFFENKELACKCCGTIILDPAFAAAFPHLRLLWGRPMRLTSVCRCPGHNKAVGGAQKSFHLTLNNAHKTNGCMAADVYWGPWATPVKLAFAQLAWKQGWSVGLNDAFCHVDLRTRAGAPLPQAVFLYGGAWQGAFGQEEVTGSLE